MPSYVNVLIVKQKALSSWFVSYPKDMKTHKSAVWSRLNETRRQYFYSVYLKL